MMNDLERNEKVRAAERRVARLERTRAGADLIGASWHHSCRLSNGEFVPGGKSLETLEHEFALTFDPIPIEGQTVLDVGAWNGAFTFEAERRGARRVVAVDEHCWFVDAFKGLETFLFRRRDLGSEAEYLALDVDNTVVERLGTFNVVLFLGVFYHLENPLNCLAQLARIADPWLVVETHCDDVNNPLPAMRYYPGTELLGDPTNWWAPNPTCMTGLLKNAGFADVLVTENPHARGRFFFHARKG